jgi:tyrosyl-tRNA synthetase
MTMFLDHLAARGFVQDATPGVAERLAGRPITAYVGFDPTASSLHVGNLVPVMGLAWLQRLGGTPIALVGGGTALVGDPSGKRSERPMLSEAEIHSNSEAIERQLRSFLRFEGPSSASVVNNAAWLGELALMEFLRETGKHFTVNYMLQKEAVRSRMESGISFTEFAYMLVQAHDFWHLFRTADVELQMGGSDQWGNITAGIELISRKEGAAAHGIVFPLLTTASGAKFGKSEQGNIWLDPARTSPYEFFQFWLNADDRDVARWLSFFTFLPLDEISAIVRAHEIDPAKRVAQRRLAHEVTALVHGEQEADRAARTGLAIFGGDGARADYAELASTMPNCEASAAELEAGLPLVDVLVRAGLASSKADARRGIQGRGFSVNDVQQDDVSRRLTVADLEDGRYILLRKGKKNHVMVVVGT